MNGYDWIYGDLICTLLYPLQTVTVFASVFTLVVLSCSRYYAIVHPFSAQPRKVHAKVLIVTIWVVSFLLGTPYMTTLQVSHDKNTGSNECKATWSSSAERTYTWVNFVLQYALPLTVMSIAYSLIVYDLNFKPR